MRHISLTMGTNVKFWSFRSILRQLCYIFIYLSYVKLSSCITLLVYRLGGGKMISVLSFTANFNLVVIFIILLLSGNLYCQFLTMMVEATMTSRLKIPVSDKVDVLFIYIFFINNLISYRFVRAPCFLQSQLLLATCRLCQSCLWCEEARENNWVTIPTSFKIWTLPTPWLSKFAYSRDQGMTLIKSSLVVCYSNTSNILSCVHTCNVDLLLVRKSIL